MKLPLSNFSRQFSLKPAPKSEGGKTTDLEEKEP